VITLKNGKEYITIIEAAKLLGVQQSRVSQYISKGDLKPNTKLVGKKLLLKDDVVKFKATRRTKPGPIPTKH